MDFHKYLQQEFGMNHQNSHLSPKEMEYYTTLSEKFYEENFFLGVASLLLGSAIFISSAILLYQVQIPPVISLLLAVNGSVVFAAIISSAIANSLFTHFRMISFGNISNFNRVMSAMNKAYVYKQTAKILFLASLIITISTCLVLTLNSRVFLAFIVCIVFLYVVMNYYISKVRISAQERTMSQLSPIIDADNPSIFSDVAVKLNNAKDKEQETDRTFSSLISVLQNPSPKVRSQAIKFLAKHATVESINMIIDKLGDPDASVRAQAAIVLGKFGERNVKEALKSLIYDESSDVRRAAAESLGRLRVGSASNMLISLLEDPAPEVRAHAAEALGSIKKPKTVPSLVAKIEDEDWFVRCKAIIALSRFSLDSDTIDKVIACTKDDSEYVREAARSALKKWKQEIPDNSEVQKSIEDTLEHMIEESEETEKKLQQEISNTEDEAEFSDHEEKITLEEDIDIDEMENW